jgi:hypothetical protein
VVRGVSYETLSGLGKGIIEYGKTLGYLLGYMSRNIPKFPAALYTRGVGAAIS